MAAIEHLLKDTIRLPSPPALAVRILEAVKKDDFSDKALYSSKHGGRNRISVLKVGH